ncbi:HlyD family secretion protein [Algoriphagus antarcticus]|uniref:HlyD family secretion protein n=1 Tax=Algoriphagus antarcticus TaxID=238540 RepID=A0A3E0DU50_9BACT|nr:HlyD family efflux transporter periplasmic adaptor subunit [Algoriphagus antarcticus]REG86395.1 HlyD family secretion protein [Algoriphagus antarcticus]
MKTFQKIIFASLFLPLVIGCTEEKTFDASGSFEAEETIISAEALGVLKQFDLEEGQVLSANQFIGYVDSVQLFLKKRQLEAQITALYGRKPNISAQLAALEVQLKTVNLEANRVSNLVKANAATSKQLDDATAQVAMIEAQIVAQKSTLNISSQGISNDATPMEVQIAQLNDQLEKSKIINPLAGTVLSKYAEQSEMTAPGKPLYKIADLSNIILRVYISGNQLSHVKLGQKVTVHTDNGEGGFDQTEGTISWINDKAEFTPKTIQTKDERANMVYAIKVDVPNDGKFKIGMYGEINFL